MDGTPRIAIDNLTFSYRESGAQGKTREVLHGITLDVQRGEHVAVLGHNGSGKSTLAKLLNLILEPDSGTIRIDGIEITDPDLSDADILTLRKKIGMVFQNPDNQMVATIAEEEVAFGPENLGLPSSEIRERVDAALGAVGMTAFAKKETARRAGVQKQRIASAGILAMEPECIVLDEPTSMLDPQGRKDVMKVIETLNRERGVTIVHITHDMNEAARAGRVIILNDGRIEMDGTPEEVFSDPDRLETLRLSVPQCTSLMHALKKEGLNIEGPVARPEDCIEALCRALGGGR